MGATLTCFGWLSWRRRALQALAKTLWQNCEETLLEIDPSIYRRPTRFQAYIEPSSQLKWHWFTNYHILLVVSLREKRDLPRVQMLTERGIAEFLGQKGHEKLKVKSHYTALVETEGAVR